MHTHEENMRICVELLRSNNILVLATQSDTGPYTSLMAYACSENGREIYMLSSRNSQKWKNLQTYPKVSLLVDDRDGKLDKKRQKIKALSVSGSFSQVTESEKDPILELIAAQSPFTSSNFSGPDYSVIKIKVESFLLLDGPKNAFHSGTLSS